MLEFGPSSRFYPFPEFEVPNEAQGLNDLKSS